MTQPEETGAKTTTTDQVLFQREDEDGPAGSDTRAAGGDPTRDPDDPVRAAVTRGPDPDEPDLTRPDTGA
jgi:hypothetical protein